MSSKHPPIPGSGDGQRRTSIILVKERNDTNLDDPYETVSTTHTHTAIAFLHTVPTLYSHSPILHRPSMASFQTFQQAGYDVSFLPALEFVFINQQTLLERFTQPHTYSALVATSPRGAAAAITALTTLATSPTTPHLLSAWQSKPFYVVGDGSAAVIARSTLSLSVQAVGGNAERLGAAIAASHPAARLLVLSGNLRRAELFVALTAGGVEWDEVTVYETRSNSRLQQQWRQLVDSTGGGGWVCYFSPSGVAGVKRCVEQEEEAATSEVGVSGGGRCVRWLGLSVAALGQTSASAVQEAGWMVQAVAASPSPAQLLAAIRTTEERQSQQQQSTESESKYMAQLSAV